MDSLHNLWSKEINAREEEVRLRLSGLWNSSEPQPEISYDDRVALLRWIHDLCLKEREESSDTKYKIPVLAVDILDRFLRVCKIKKSQLQLTGVVCVCLASKLLSGVRTIPIQNLITATDNSIKASELRAWELLVLSKLGWNLESVIPQDYFENIPSGIINDSTVVNASLIIALSLLEKGFYSAHSKAAIAFGALSLALKEDDQIHEIQHQILDSVALNQNKVDDVRSKLEAIMWTLLGTSSPKRLDPEEAPLTSVSPASSSTPKSKAAHSNNQRSPLKEVMILRQREARKRLVSDFDEDFEELNKENNDSAIGLNTSGLTEIPSSSSESSSSSAQSSPDSASSKTLRPSKSSAELDRVIKTTQIPPLKKWWETNHP